MNNKTRLVLIFILNLNIFYLVKKLCIELYAKL